MQKPILCSLGRTNSVSRNKSLSPNTGQGPHRARELQARLLFDGRRLGPRDVVEGVLEMLHDLLRAPDKGLGP